MSGFGVRRGLFSGHEIPEIVVRVVQHALERLALLRGQRFEVAVQKSGQYYVQFK